MPSSVAHLVDRRARVGVLALAVAFLPSFGCSPRAAPEPTEDAASARVETAATFVGRTRCTECHARETELWTASHHDLAMQHATEDSVLGDFDDATFTHDGADTRFSRDGDTYSVRTLGPSGETVDYPVVFTFGVEPLQQYLVELPGGRYQALGIAWDARAEDQGGQRWFDLYPDLVLEPGDPLHWTGVSQNWNRMCAECHSTNLEKRYLADEQRYETTFSEIDVSCEACHGPGSRHAAWADGGSDADGLDAAAMQLVVDLSNGNPTWSIDATTGLATRNPRRAAQPEVEACGRCHSRRGALVDDYEFGLPLADTHRVALLDDVLYHADGQILDEVFVYGSFVQSRMYDAGVTCSDCHEPHSLRVYAQGNALCNQCHLAAAFDTPEHHFHDTGTEGAACVSCHMPDRTYMIVDPRRDHGFRVPRPDQSAAFGVPNACDSCHADEGAGWSAAAVRRLYGEDRTRGAEWTEAISGARTGHPESETRLLAVAAGLANPAIVRATAFQLLPPYLTQASLAAVQGALGDGDPLVRRAAVEVLTSVDPRAAVGALAPMLRDSNLPTRLDAAHALAALPADAIPSQYRSTLQQVLDEYRRTQLFHADSPEGQTNLGWLAMVRGDAPASQLHYERALQIDATFAPAHINLADLYRAQGREAESEQALRAAIGLVPGEAALYHSLGLTLVRRQRLLEALDPLRRAAELAPAVARYAYVLGVGVHTSGDVEGALRLLDAAHARFPANRDILVALATFARDAGDRDRAIEYARRLRALAPGDPQVLALVRSLEEAR
ncbi:MAG TPA: HEAT repeat domain-containing protein [Acidobacteriota bacterium]|nr:HEAT repeat domain-containing protein [Acidobacteriota bacterium]